MLQIFILAGLGIFSMISEIIGIKKWLPYITLLVLVANIISIFSGMDISGDWVTSMYNNSLKNMKMKKTLQNTSVYILSLQLVDY
jgi:hypothetical protein